ncbi:hypothetical protein [Algivirga pacifica]|uniref:Uncharacterized protein n=1 Tax=Algivirga pacifica TaxID=1162670 RepID=A0ABP9D4S6_9BACT
MKRFFLISIILFQAIQLLAQDDSSDALIKKKIGKEQDVHVYLPEGDLSLAEKTIQQPILTFNEFLLYQYRDEEIMTAVPISAPDLEGSAQIYFGDLVADQYSYAALLKDQTTRQKELIIYMEKSTPRAHINYLMAQLKELKRIESVGFAFHGKKENKTIYGVKFFPTEQLTKVGEKTFEEWVAAGFELQKANAVMLIIPDGK